MIRTNYKSLSAKIEEARIRTHAWALGCELEFPGSPRFREIMPRKVLLRGKARKGQEKLDKEF